MQDKAGHDIKVGDYIVYGHVLGSCGGLRYGVVLGFKSRTYFYDEEYDVVRVRGYDDDYDKPLSRDSYLEYSTRILVITAEQLPIPVVVALETFRQAALDGNV